MNSNIEQALKYLESYNYGGYFGEMDKVDFPSDIIPIYSKIKANFFSGNASSDFHAKIIIFTKEVKNIIAESKEINQEDTLHIKNTKAHIELLSEKLSLLKEEEKKSTLPTVKFRIVQELTETKRELSKAKEEIKLSEKRAEENKKLKEQNKKLKKVLNREIFKISYITAQPIDNVPLRTEFDKISNVLSLTTTNKYVSLLSLWETDYSKILRHLINIKPNILHYSGHGDKDSIHLMSKKTGRTQKIDNYELTDIFGNTNNYLKLVFLNSCFSSHQAEVISKFGIYVLGINQEVKDEIAINLAEEFYVGVESQEYPINIEKAIYRGCNSFFRTYEEYTDYISLWKDGQQIDYKTFEPIKK